MALPYEPGYAGLGGGGLGAVVPSPRHALAIWLRNATVFSKLWKGALLPTFIDPFFYLLALGFGLGTYIAHGINGIPYKEFVAPGLMAATAMQIASFESSWPVLSAIKWDRQYHAMLATPLRVRDVMLGHQAYFAFRIFLTAAIYLVVITAFGAVSSPLGLLAVPVTVLVGLCFSGPIAYTASGPSAKQVTTPLATSASSARCTPEGLSRSSGPAVGRSRRRT